ASLPELPAARRPRLELQYEISSYDADQLTEEPTTADLFEATVAAGAPAKQAANWIIRSQPTLDAASLAELIGMVVNGPINHERRRGRGGEGGGAGGGDGAGGGRGEGRNGRGQRGGAAGKDRGGRPPREPAGGRGLQVGDAAGCEGLVG